MAEVIKLPKMSDTMEEGVIVKWIVKTGDTVKPGDILAEVETDKATMELENFAKGTVLLLKAEEGVTIPVNEPIAVVGNPGEDISNIFSEKSNLALLNTKENASTVKIKSTEPEQKDFFLENDEKQRLKISPLARKIAVERGIEISKIEGSGDNGRIIKRDLELINSNSPKTISKPSENKWNESFKDVPVSQMRKTIAARLAESKFSSPHFYLTMEINMDKVYDARDKINKFAETKISFNDFVVKACAIALQKHPTINSSWLGNKIRYNNHIHLGIAVSVDEGLLVPVVRFANHKSISDLSIEIKDLSLKAKNKKLQPADWQGNTFTISSLGMFGIEEFTAIINPPDSCILAVGAIKDTVGIINGEIKPVKTMKVTLSCDHRVVDGVSGAKFLNTLKEILEEPVILIA
ncbi:MAG: 2-oxo acid dehydrogenase subunit E2 [Bacteroidetes bacterium]|nr:2-oxo acid dehydrogenase subunit E2 [Bacteroidota bacterium]